MRAHPIALAAVLALLCATPATVRTDDPEGLRPTQGCVVHRQVRATRVIDDRHILFEFAGNRYMVNTLVAPCPGLGRERRYAQQLRSALLCRGDLIEVLPRFGWGSTCTLGDFEVWEAGAPAPPWPGEPVAAPGEAAPGSEHD